jgi:hypothetical protein
LSRIRRRLFVCSFWSSGTGERQHQRWGVDAGARTGRGRTKEKSARRLKLQVAGWNFLTQLFANSPSQYRL